MRHRRHLAVESVTSRIWTYGRAAREQRKEIYRVARGLPDFEKFGLASQFRRAAISVTAHLAEGFRRFGLPG
jgi:hypothetical protein